MALPEACGLWIEQRVQEELDAKGDTGASLREIGRTVAAEVEKHFETKVKPETIYHRARKQSKPGTTLPPKEKPVKSESKPKLEKLEKKKHGGKRGGSERKPMITDAETFARMGISQLERLRDVPKKERVKALITVEEWIYYSPKLQEMTVTTNNRLDITWFDRGCLWKCHSE